VRTHYYCYVKILFSLALLLALLCPAFVANQAHAGNAITQNIGLGSASGGVLPGPGGGSYFYYKIKDANDTQLRRLPADLRMHFNSGAVNYKRVYNLLKRRKAFRKNNGLKKYFLKRCRDNKLTDSLCPYWKQRRAVTSGTGYQQLKMSYGPGGWGGRGTKAVTAFAVRIWREDLKTGKMNLIFDRSIRGNGQEGIPFTGVGQRTASNDWWRAGNRGYYSTSGSRGGPIGANNSARVKNCRYGRDNPVRGEGGPGNEDINLRSNKRVYTKQSLFSKKTDLYEKQGNKYKVRGACYWEGSRLNPAFNWSGNVAGWIRRNGISAANRAKLKSNQFGGKKHWFTNRMGFAGTGLKEAVFLQWFIPENKGRARLRTKIMGAPGVIYAVQHVALGYRNEIKAQKFFSYIPSEQARPGDTIPPGANLIVTKTGNGGGGVVDNSGKGLSCLQARSRCGYKYPKGTKVELRITPNNSSELKGVKGCSLNSTRKICTVSLNKNTNVYINFRLKPDDSTPPPPTTPDWKKPGVSFELEYDASTTVQKESKVKSTIRVDRSGADSGSGNQEDPPPGADDDNANEVLSEAEMSVSSQSEDNPSADVFPVARTFFHYTPQGKYSSKGYKDYTIYSEPSLPLRLGNLNENQNIDISPNPEKYENEEKIMRISVPEDVTEDDWDEKSGSVAITWQKPTLQNPCDKERVYDREKGEWPGDTRTGGEKCNPTNSTAFETSLFNAWDDLLIGQINYDLVYQVKRQDKNSSVAYKRVPLRCNLALASSVEVVAKDSDECPFVPNPFGGGEVGTRFMPAGLPVAGRFAPAETDDSQSGTPARIVLESTNPVSLSASDGEETIATEDRNPLTDKMELNLCQTGRPLSGQPLSLPEGDPDCLSPLAKWQWNETGAGNRWETCQQSGTLSFSSFIEDEAAPTSAVVAGSQRAKDINDLLGGNWEDDVLPYVGKLPGDEMMRCAWRYRYSNLNNEIYKVQVSSTPATGYSKISDNWCRTRDDATWLQRSDSKPSGSGWVKPCYRDWYLSTKKVRVRSSKADGYTLSSAKWCRARDYATWLQRSNSDSRPSGNGWVSPCYYERYPYIANTDTNTAVSGAHCSINAAGTAVTENYTGAPPTKQCSYKRYMEWDYAIDASSTWRENWDGRGYVKSGSWQLAPIYPERDGLRRYVGPGYVKNDGAALDSADSELSAVNGIAVSGKSDAIWNIYSSFETYQDYPFVYERGKKDEEGYISVLAPRLSG
jgi:hypothetical protein